MPPETPAFRRLLLGHELRELREARGLTARSVSQEMEVAPSWVTRIENGQRGIQTRDLRRLFDLYQVHDERRRERLLELAQQSKKHGWWEPFKSSLPPKYADYVGLESSATRIRNVEMVVVPGLVQTEEYARHLLLGGMHSFTEEEVASRLTVRLQRQQNLDQRREETSLDVILDESVLLRVVGGAAVMRRQLARMVEMVEGAKATIRILPLSQGVHVGSSESFVILDLPGEALKPIPYIETVAGDLYLEKPDDIATCETAWAYLEGLALDAEDSAAKIREIMESYEKDAEGGA
ncbi:helix-turn-helix domain-containing protein [Nocardiopsis protaetiae]|uniref:helix-turn-helix domain-containing protein n=1 Tax=Nocardiopsis protaetiae TaxID=3382270 RepID=UPI00387A9B78